MKAGENEKMQRIITKIGYLIQPSRFIPRTLKSFFEKIVFTFVASETKKHILFHGKASGYPVFCIVHWNAPDFLLLNIDQIEFLYPNSRIYVLDNGSKQANIGVIQEALKRFDNITLFAAAPEKRNCFRKLALTACYTPIQTVCNSC